MKRIIKHIKYIINSFITNDNIGNETISNKIVNFVDDLKIGEKILNPEIVSIKQAQNALDNADFDDYFKIMQDIVPSEYLTIFNQKKKEFIVKGFSVDLVQALKVLTRDIERMLCKHHPCKKEKRLGLIALIKSIFTPKKKLITINIV